MTSNIQDIPAESVDYSEEAGLPVEEAVRGEPATEDHFMTETGIMPDNEINQHSVMVAPPSVITQSTMMRYMYVLVHVHLLLAMRLCSDNIFISKLSW